MFSSSCLPLSQCYFADSLSRGESTYFIRKGIQSGLFICGTAWQCLGMDHLWNGWRYIRQLSSAQLSGLISHETKTTLIDT